jgi:GDP-L-fucose synthase
MNAAMKKRIVICGATGFIGRNLAEHFAAVGTYNVVGVHNRRPPYSCVGVEWVKADLTRHDDVERALDGADILIQAAATTSGARDIVMRPHIHVADNAVMNSLLFRAAHDRGIEHVVFFSCTVMLPSSPRALRETDFDANAALYPRYFGTGWTKVYIEKMCEFYSSVGSTKYTAIRHSNIYGPHDKFDLEHSHVFGATVTKVMTATDGRITVWGTGEEARDLLYVGDLVDFVTRAIERQTVPFGLYNCGSGEATPINEIIARIVAKSGRQLTIEYDLGQPTIKTSVFVDCSKAAHELGWHRSTSLDEGIARTIGWWKANVAGQVMARAQP